jgi:hypothetical protein
MNEQAIQDAYNLFVQQGYGKSIDDFKNLIATNPNALNDSYNLFTQQGYGKSIEDYKALMGLGAQPDLKKKVQGPMALPSEDSFLASQSQLPKFETTPLKNITRENLPKYTKAEEIVVTEPTEEDYFTGAFGNVLRGFDNVVPIGIGDFVDDMARSVASGYRQRTSAQEADKLLLQGTKPTIEQIQKFIEANKNARSLGVSAEMQDYQKTYEEEGKSFWGVVKGLAKNPTVIPELITSSLTAMATNTDALTAGASVVATGAAYGAATGAAAGGIGALPGAAAGAIASAPYAFGLASSVVEMGSTFGELLEEELGGKEMTKENVKAILENPDKLNSIRNRAIARGAIIGTVDAFTGKLATGVGAKIVGKSASKSATGSIAKSALVKAAAAGAGIEGVGGSLGEATARAAIGQEMDVSEISLEGLAELPGGIRSTIQARLARPSYKVNGAKATAQEVDELINTMTPAELAKTKIDIKNDFEGRKFKIQDKIVTNSIKEQVRQGNPELNETSLNAITELEKELKKLEGNTTQTGKDKAAAIRGQIKNIQENQLQEEAVVETIKSEQDAIQEQTTDEGVLRTEQPEVGLQQVVEGDQGPQVTTTGTQETITPESTQEVDNRPISERQAEAESKIKRKDLFTGVGEFSSQLGGSDKSAVPISHREINGIEFVEYAHPETGSVDVIVTGTSGNDYVGFYRIYENGKPTNKWSSKFENQSRNKNDFKTMISGVQSLLPQGHEYTEKVSISTDGLRVWNQQLEKGYELQYDENGNLITNSVFINGDAIVNELGVPVNKGNFDNVKVQTLEDFNKVKEALIPYLKKFNLGEQNIKLVNGSVKIDLPVLKKQSTVSSKTQPTEDIYFNKLSKSEKFNDNASVSTYLGNLDNSEGEKNIFYTLPNKGIISFKEVKSNTNRFSLTANAKNDTPSDIKNAFKRIEKYLPPNHELVEDKSISVDGLRVWNNFIKNGKYIQTGKINEIEITPIDKGNLFKDLKYTTENKWSGAKFENKNKALARVKKYLKDNNLDFKVKLDGNVIKVEVPVLKYKLTETQQNEEPTTKPTGGPVSGNRLFNKPIKAVSEIANRYYQRIFGTERPRYFGSRGLDEARGKRLAQAFIDMKHNPNYPEVKASYEALAKETLDQYQAFLDAGYTIEINNEEPYASSQDMIEDLRKNKRIKIFSTESGFGSKKITKKQRQDNPLLAKTEFKDINGKPLLVNDVFRAIHDFFGHAELGNSFGPKGEENAWNVHVRMFSPLARRAMTTETRGQNSFVNFSGVNDKIEKDRDEARRLREAGDLEGAKKLVDKIYEEGSFADQKIGLLPEEFSQFDEQDMGDVSMRPEGLQERDTEAEPTLVIEEEQFVPMQASEVKTDAFTKDNAIDYLEDEKETESGRTVTYISSLTVEARNADGDPIGTITKLTDEDKMFSFTAEDIDGNEIGFDGFETLGEAKQAVADSYNKIKKKEFTKEQKKKAKEKAKVEAKKAKAKAKAEPTVEEQVTGALDDLLALDPNDKTTLQKIQSGLDKVIKDIDKFEKENLGVNIALPVMKTILKAIKALVDAGVVLQEAIKRVAKDNNVNSRDVIDGINAVSQIAPIQAQYDALMTKADELIARQKSRGIADAKIVSNLDTLIRNSEVYKNANDAQKKIMEREARTKMGAAPKRAVSIGRVLGALKDITNISREEKMLVIKQIRDLSRDAAKELAKDIREMASKGKITSIQAANIVSRFGKVNMLNEISVSNFVDYMAKVFANAEYADKIDVAKSKLKMAKKNIVTKIGIADGLVGPLNRLFSINPTLIPNDYLGRYLELVDMFGARQAVLTLDEKSAVTKDVEAILNEIDNEQSKADELADRFNASENKVFKDDELDYAASVKKMLDEKEIDEKEAETMRKYKDDIAPQVEETELTEDELAEERKELTDAVKKSIVDGSELSTKDERDLAKELRRLLGTDAVDGLTNTELKNLLKVIGNINNNYLPHYTQLMVEKMNAINNGKVLTSAVKKSKVAPLSGLYSRAKSLITKKDAIFEMIRRNPLFNIDQLFGDFKTKDIFNSILNKAAEGEAKFSAELKKVQNILEKAEEKVAKSFKLDPNKTLMSKFKMMTYMIQLEFESNKGNKEVNPAANYLKATIKHIDAGKSQFAEREAEMLQDILNQYSDADGNIDNEKLYNSFNQAEKDAIKDIRGVNESLREKAEYTAAIIRGDRISPLNNYVHLNVLHEHQPNDLTAGSAFITEYNDSMRPSTKAKSLIARTGKVSPLNFDVFASAQRGAKFVLMDYNLTEPIRTARKTINQTVANLEQEGRIPKEKREIINAINSAFEEAIENLLTNTYVSTSIADDVIDYINKQGYRAILAGTGRFISELSSNIGFALISDPKAFTEGVKYKGVIMSTDAPLIMENVNSKQTNRIFPTDTLSGKLIDTSILNQASGIKGGKAKNAVANKIQQIWNLSGKKYTNFIELQADALISTPDKAIMRPMWFGSFANQFKNITGKDVDFEKIAANDEAYMEANKEAIDKAKTLADERSVMTGATDNAFMGILKGTTKPNQSATLRAFNNFNNFMTRFLIFEFVTARTAINAAMGNGSLDKKQGAALLGAVTTRMIVYTLLTQMMGAGLMGLFFDDEEEETEKSFMQKLGQAFTSAFTSLTLGRDFGNATKMMVNYGLERVNENYLDFLREGDYDPYKDAIQYSIVPAEQKGRQRDLSDFLLNMGGAFGPALKTADFITRKALEPEKTKEDAIERRKKELNIRIPLEVLGNAGLVPLYKDIRKAVMKDLYKDLEKADRNKGDKKKAEEEKLQGFQNQEDMKRYDYDLWYRTFGPDAPDYDAKQAEKLIKREKDSVERAMKDEMYDYTPKPKKGKGGLQKLY